MCSSSPLCFLKTSHIYLSHRITSTNFIVLFIKVLLFEVANVTSRPSMDYVRTMFFTRFNPISCKKPCSPNTTIGGRCRTPCSLVNVPQHMHIMLCWLVNIYWFHCLPVKVLLFEVATVTSWPGMDYVLYPLRSNKMWEPLLT